jgi:hypothetical protein
MNKLITFLIIILLTITSCSNFKYTEISTEIIDGKVSAIETGRNNYPISRFRLPAIYVQNSKQTVRVEIPFEYENKWKVGDSCLLIVKKYKESE